ncbi:unnamed protein product [Amoebophrya sp. A120]|nr:unnamed protein product [Amoebophrya sp. A120]|eukprot:GSA120T00000380001.1
MSKSSLHSQSSLSSVGGALMRTGGTPPGGTTSTEEQSAGPRRLSGQSSSSSSRKAPLDMNKPRTATPASASSSSAFQSRQQQQQQMQSHQQRQNGRPLVGPTTTSSSSSSATAGAARPQVVIENRGGKPRAVWQFFPEGANEDDDEGSDEQGSSDPQKRVKEAAFDQTVRLQRGEDPELRRIRQLTTKQKHFSPTQDFKYGESDFEPEFDEPGRNDQEVAPEERVGFSFAARRSPEELASVINKRVDILYSDHKIRAMRREALVKEKERMEEEFYKMQQQLMSGATKAGRKEINIDEFHEYWKERVQEYQDTQMIRQKLKEQKEAVKEREELAECTFKPDLGGSDRWSKARQQVIGKYKEKFLRMATLQFRELKSLEDLHTVEAGVEYNLKLECEQKLTEVLQENPTLVDRFLSTEKGSTLLKNRTQAYLQANPQIAKDRAEAEALSDILNKSRENIRDRVLDDYRARRIHQRRALAIRKLHVVVELQRLEHEYREMALNVKGDKTLVVAAMKAIEADYHAKYGNKFTPPTRESVRTHETESSTTRKSATVEFRKEKMHNLAPEKPTDSASSKNSSRGWGRRMAGDPLRRDGGNKPKLPSKAEEQKLQEQEEQKQAEEVRKRGSGMFFQTDLVARLKKDPWFLVAKHAAATETMAQQRAEMLEREKAEGGLPKFPVNQCIGSHMA